MVYMDQSQLIFVQSENGSREILAFLKGLFVCFAVLGDKGNGLNEPMT